MWDGGRVIKNTKPVLCNKKNPGSDQGSCVCLCVFACVHVYCQKVLNIFMSAHFHCFSEHNPTRASKYYPH